jgi:hypothetical protein
VRLSLPLRRPREHSDIDSGHEGEHYRSLHAGGPNWYKADPSLRSFLLTLKNPHNCPAWKFALKGTMKDKAIHCTASRGPDFSDIDVSNRCNTTSDSFTCDVGLTYAHNTKSATNPFFTGSEDFIAKEIEGLEITSPA